MRVCVCARVCVSAILCVLGCSCQPAEASLSIIKACHWLVHRFGQPIRDTDVRSVWKIGEEAVERKRRTWSDRLGLTVRTFQDFVYFPFTTQRHSVPYHQWCARISFCLLILFSCSIYWEILSFSTCSSDIVAVAECLNTPALTWIEEYQVGICSCSLK